MWSASGSPLSVTLFLPFPPSENNGVTLPVESPLCFQSRQECCYLRFLTIFFSPRDYLVWSISPEVCVKRRTVCRDAWPPFLTNTTDNSSESINGHTGWTIYKQPPVVSEDSKQYEDRLPVVVVHLGSVRSECQRTISYPTLNCTF